MIGFDWKTMWLFVDIVKTELAELVLVSSPFNAAEGVLISLFGLNLKVKGTCSGGASGKVDTWDLLKTQVHRWLVDVDEASLQWVEEAWRCFVWAGDALSPRVTVGERRMLNKVYSTVLCDCVWTRYRPLEVSWHSDLAVDQGLHYSADHLIQGPRHVFTEFTLKTTFNILPVTQINKMTC